MATRNESLKKWDTKKNYDDYLYPQQKVNNFLVWRPTLGIPQVLNKTPHCQDAAGMLITRVLFFLTFVYRFSQA